MSLEEFLIELAKSPYLQGRFRENPDGVMDEMGLSDAEKQLVKDGDKNAIAAAISGSQPAGAATTITCISLTAVIVHE